MPIARPLDPAHIALEESLEESFIASALMCASFNRRGSVDFARRMTDRVPLVGSMCAELGVAEIRIVEKLSSLVYSRNPERIQQLFIKIKRTVLSCLSRVKAYR